MLRSEIQNQINLILKENPKITEEGLKTSISEWLDNLNQEKIADSKLKDAKSEVEVTQDIEHKELKKRILDDLISYEGVENGI